MCWGGGTLGPSWPSPHWGFPWRRPSVSGCPHRPSESHLLAFFPSLFGVGGVCFGSLDSGSPGCPNRVPLSRGEAPGWLPLLLPCQPKPACLGAGTSKLASRLLSPAPLTLLLPWAYFQYDSQLVLLKCKSDDITLLRKKESESEVAQYHSLPGSSLHGILQARVLE